MFVKWFSNLRIELKLAGSYVFATVVSVTLFVGVLYSVTRGLMLADLRAHLRDQVATAALLIDGDAHARLLTEADQAGADYAALLERLRAVLAAGTGVADVYTMRQAADGQILFVVDGALEEPAALGEVYLSPSALLVENFATLKEPLVEPDLYTDEWGTWLSGYAPFYSADGRREGIVAIDLAADGVVARERQLLLNSLLLFVVLVPLGAGLGLVLARTFSRPLVALTARAEHLARVDLASLTAATTALAHGDLTQRVTIQATTVPEASGDELGLMTRAFNLIVEQLQRTGAAYAAMTHQLQTVVQQVAANATGLGAASADMATAAEQVGQASGQISATMQQVAHGASDQANNVTQTAAAIETVQRAIDAVAAGARDQALTVEATTTSMGQLANSVSGLRQGAESQAADLQQAGAAQATLRGHLAAVEAAANQVAATSQLTAESAGAGAQLAAESAAGMERVQATTDQLARSVRDLGKSTGQIGAIVETIDDIAAQTNLLALNAAIEAARAGEHGRGFAIVADEVRKLAERSAEATHEIAAMVRSTRTGVDDVVTAMQQTAADVRTAAGATGEAGAAFQSIVGATQTLMGQVAAIETALAAISASGQAFERSVHTATATASHNLAAAATMEALNQQVAASLQHLSAVVAENAATTERMAASAYQTTQAVEAIASVSEENSAAVEQVSAAATEVSGQVAAVTASAQTLAVMAQTQQDLVSQFILSSEVARSPGRPAQPVALPPVRRAPVRHAERVA